MKKIQHYPKYNRVNVFFYPVSRPRSLAPRSAKSIWRPVFDSDTVRRSNWNQKFQAENTVNKPKFICAAFASLLLIVFCSSAGWSQKPKLPFIKSRSGSSAQSTRDLTQRDGPWLIMCWSFTGEQAEPLARQLAAELRQHRLKALLYRHQFDYSGTTTGLGWATPDDEGNFSQLRMKSANPDVIQEVAVLVGDFSSADDHRAQKILKKIKSMPINSIPEFAAVSNSEKNRSESGPFSVPDGGPLRTALLVPNPLLPEAYFQQDTIDKFVLKINRGVEFSLLECPGLYSVRVASFRGDSTIDPTRIENGASQLELLQRNGKSLTSSRLHEAEEKARILTEALRDRGVEAYQFHDRHESVVCIGSFDWVTRESEGTTMNNPEIVRIVNSCKPEIRDLPNHPNAMIPKSIGKIPLDPDPAPIMVPKADPSRQAKGRLSFMRR